MLAKLFIVSSLLCGSLSAHNTRTDHMIRLKRDLFFEYDTTIIPLKDNEALDVKVGMAMIKMDFNQLAELSINSWIRAMWKDYRLSWDPKTYGDIDVIRIPASEIWKPDLKIYNELEYNYGTQFETTDSHAVVYPDGTVLVIPPIHSKVQCEEELELKNWPWGEYDCNIKIGSWTFDGFKMNTTLFTTEGSGEEQNGIDVETLAKNSPFLFTANSFTEPSVERKYYSCCKEPYPAVNFKFKLQKQFQLGEDGHLEMNPDPKPVYSPEKYKPITPGN